jgi:hypothetical protein
MPDMAKFTEPDDADIRLEEYNAWAVKRGLTDTRVHFIVPPAVDRSGHWFMTGYTMLRCDPGSVSYSVAEEANYYVQARFLHSRFAALHELGHSTGAADNYSDCNAGIMFGGILGCVDTTEEHYSKRSKAQIKQCLSGED